MGRIPGAPDSLYEQLTTKGGEYVDFGTLLTVTAGLLVGSFMSGLSAVIQGVIRAWAINPLQGFGTWIDLVLSGSTRAITGPINVAVLNTKAFVSNFGILAFLVAISLVLGGLLGAVWLWTEYGGGSE